MLPTISLTGDFFEMGEAFGEQFRYQTQNLVDIRINRIIRLAQEYTGQAINEQDVLTIGRQLIPVHQQYCLSLWQEFTGIARGAHLTHPQLLIGMAYTDVLDYILRKLKAREMSLSGGGCTAFILPACLGTVGSPLCGQTWDMFAEALEFVVIVKRQPKIGPSTLWLTTMGGLGLIGVNQFGVACGTTNLVPNDSTLGVSYLFTISKSLMQVNLADAKQTVIKTPRLSGHSFYLVDDKTGVNLETSVLKVAEQNLDQAPIIQTNHYQNHSLISSQAAMLENDLLNSQHRYDRALDLTTQRADWSMEDCWQILLADNQSNPNGAAICNQTMTGQTAVTAATVLINPERRMLWAVAGGAKGNPPQEYYL